MSNKPAVIKTTAISTLKVKKHSIFIMSECAYVETVISVLKGMSGMVFTSQSVSGDFSDLTTSKKFIPNK